MSALPGKHACLASVLLCMAWGPQVHAQADEAVERPIAQIDVSPDPRMAGGESAFLEGDAEAAVQWFVVGDLDVMQPISVGVYTRGRGDDVRVRIVKDDWDKPEREASTGGTGKAEFYFRTFDDFKIGVDAKVPTRYQLVVWRGDEIQVAPPAIAVPASEFLEPANEAAPQGGGSAAGRSAVKGGVSLSYLELALLGLLLTLVAGLAAVKHSRRP